MDPEQKTPLAHKFFMSQKNFTLLISFFIVIVVLFVIFYFYNKNKKANKEETQLNQAIENVAQRAASITTTPEQKLKMVNELQKEKAYTVSPKESKNADEKLIQDFLNTQ